MNLKQELLKEHSKSQCDKIVAYIGSDKQRFAELMDLFFSGQYRLTQRAAWPFSYCLQHHPELISPYYNRLLDSLLDSGLHESVRRNILRVFQDIVIPTKYHGRLMSCCFEFIQSNVVSAAIKAFSLTVLYHLSEKYKEIRPELKLIIEERWNVEKPSFHARAKKILKSLEKSGS